MTLQNPYMYELGSSALRALLQLARLGTMAVVARGLGYTLGAVSEQIPSRSRPLEGEAQR